MNNTHSYRQRERERENERGGRESLNDKEGERER
jgi:hypothetical protein